MTFPLLMPGRRCPKTPLQGSWCQPFRAWLKSGRWILRSAWKWHFGIENPWKLFRVWYEMQCVCFSHDLPVCIFKYILYFNFYDVQWSYMYMSPVKLRVFLFKLQQFFQGFQVKMVMLRGNALCHKHQLNKGNTQRTGGFSPQGNDPPKAAITSQMKMK